ncbi:MAG: VOC family protein [Chloroflexi bacterium]|jgi:catechol 2,3-dioxygenase-like lactoylglutathione lyase family enzyme|nr:VOC family protein [Chloroflexota bacterium]
MSNYVPSTEQLVSEIVCRDVQRSAAFYRQLGFEMVRDDGDFAIVAWEGHQLFLGELASFHNHEVEHVELPPIPPFPAAYLRIMVPNVDDYWQLVNAMGARILVPIADRYYGLRDFIFADPDGYGLRFASASKKE